MTEGQLIIILPDAAKAMQSRSDSGEPSILTLDAAPDTDGGFDCSVSLVAEMPQNALVEEIEGVRVAFCRDAESIFAGAILGLNVDGELTLEMAEGDPSGCDHCGDGDGGGNGGCGDGGCNCGH